MCKPKYSVPSMSDIAAVKHNGCTAISTFSGCGGSTLGYRMAGFKVLWANEFIDIAKQSYRANNPNTIVSGKDIREIPHEQILDEVGLESGELDLLDGSPPCSSFSAAGSRERGWGKVKLYSENATQRTDDLFFEFSRLVKGIQPKVFVAENVSGLVMGKAKGYFKLIHRSLSDAGYNVRASVLDAQWLGVPQVRRRVIFVGVRNGIDKQPVHPRPLGYRYSITEAFEESMPEPEPETTLEGYAVGREWGMMKLGTSSDKYFSLIKPDPSKPCPTITAVTCGTVAAAGVCHPYEKRKFSLAELKRLCSFPDDYTFIGDFEQKAERMGRAVPPVMMKHIADSIYNKILR